jgi:signal transduction histidine kinase
MKDPEIPSDLRSHPILLRFFDPATEKDFHHFCEIENIPLIRAVLLLSILSWMASLGLIYFIFPQAFQKWLVVLCTSLMPILVIALIITFQKRCIGWLQAIGAFTNASSAMVWIFCNCIILNNYMTATFGIIVHILFGSAKMHLKFMLFLIASLSYLIIFELFLFHSASLSAGERAIFSFAVLVPEVLSMYSAYVNEKQVRVKFVQNKIILLQHRKQLAHTEKLAAIGTLVAGVAHEINNPNNSILLDAQTQNTIWEALIPTLDEKQSTEGDFEIGGFRYSELKNEISRLNPRIERNAQRIHRLVDDLRLLSRKEMEVFDNVEFNDVVRSALLVIDYLINKCTRRFSINYGEHLPFIRGNPNYLEQVVINLVKNACQALPNPEKGVFISTSFDEKQNRIILVVRDEGSGIEKTNLDHIFDPFFTTKNPNEGTGLGLSICNNIIKSHGGRTEIDSNIGEGTTIKVFLPTAIPV